MELEKNSILGYLIEITAEYFVAKLTSGPEGFSSGKMVGMDRVVIGQVGSYLMVEQFDKKVLCTVESMWKETEAGGNESYKVRITPLGEYHKSRGFERGITHYPTTGAELHLVSTWDLEKIFSDYSEVFYKLTENQYFVILANCT